MRYIKQNQREIGRKEYWGSDDPNIVIQTQVISAEIHLDKLRASIQALEEELASSEPIELPEALLNELNQTMTNLLRDDGEMFQKISGLVYAQNNQSPEPVQAELDRLNALLAEATQ